SPWIFDDGFDVLGIEAKRAYKDRVIRRHMALIQEQCVGRHALSQMQRHLAWYTEGLAHAANSRARIFQTQSPTEVWEVFQECVRLGDGRDGAGPRGSMEGRPGGRSPRR